MATSREILELLIKGDSSSAVAALDRTSAAASKTAAKTGAAGDASKASFLKMAAGATGVGAIVGSALFKMATDFEHLALKAHQFALATGLDTDAASRFIEVSRDLNIESETLEGALGKLNKAAEATPEAFQKIGAAIALNSDGSRNVQQTFLNVVDAFQSIGGVANHAAEATAIFGRGYQGLAAIMGESSAKIKADLAGVSSGQVITDSEYQKAKSFHDALDSLHDSFTSMALTVGEDVTPAMTALANGITDIAHVAGPALAQVNKLLFPDDPSKQSVGDRIKADLLGLGIPEIGRTIGWANAKWESYNLNRRKALGYSNAWGIGTVQDEATAFAQLANAAGSVTLATQRSTAAQKVEMQVLDDKGNVLDVVNMSEKQRIDYLTKDQIVTLAQGDASARAAEQSDTLGVAFGTVAVAAGEATNKTNDYAKASEQLNTGLQGTLDKIMGIIDTREAIKGLDKTMTEAITAADKAEQIAEHGYSYTVTDKRTHRKRKVYHAPTAADQAAANDAAQTAADATFKDATAKANQVTAEKTYGEIVTKNASGTKTYTEATVRAADATLHVKDALTQAADAAAPGSPLQLALQSLITMLASTVPAELEAAIRRLSSLDGGGTSSTNARPGPTTPIPDGGGDGGANDGTGGSKKGPTEVHYHITNQIPPGANLHEIGKATVEAIRTYERSAGKGWRT